jgi:hypothetical protein
VYVSRSELLKARQNVTILYAKTLSMTLATCYGHCYRPCSEPSACSEQPGSWPSRRVSVDLAPWREYHDIPTFSVIMALSIRLGALSRNMLSALGMWGNSCNMYHLGP